MKPKVTFIIVCIYCLLVTSCSDMLSEYVQKDDRPPYIGDVRITNDAGISQSPILAWTGAEYGVAWYDYRDGNSEIYFARLYPDGTKK
jgi:hypothetical protein